MTLFKITNPRLIFLVLFQGSFCAFSASAAESTAHFLEKTKVRTKATFESLSEDSILPKKKINLTETNENANLLTNLSESLAFPSKNYGYPSGGQGISLGGRSIEDTQVTTLGVPLSLPQGGGADLSMFPSYLWSGAEISLAPSQAGFSPQAASGGVELKLWTREATKSKATFNYNREVQSFSIGARYDQTAVLVGSEFGKQEGPSGSVSHSISEDPRHHIMFHLLGSDLKGNSPGSKNFPSPNAVKKVWRIIPVLESHQELTPDLILETTLFSDLNRIHFSDPSNSLNDSDARTYQYGVENAFLVQSFVFGLSVRSVRLDSSYFQSHEEWPIHFSASRDFQLSPKLIFAGMISYDYVNLVGSGFGGKTGLKYALDSENSLFTEIQTLPKMPSLVSRYYQSGTQFIGYPNLKPEQVTFATLGHDFKNKTITQMTTYLKAEHREQVQLLVGNSMQNSGKANSLSFNQDSEISLSKFFRIKNAAVISASRVDALNISYPDLPRYSDRLQFGFFPYKELSVHSSAQLIGDSETIDGFPNPVPTQHAGYALYHLNVSHLLILDHTYPLIVTAGIENVFDRRAEPVLGYPLPGRIVHLGFSGTF